MSDEVIMHDVNCQSDAGRVRKVYQVISEELLGIVDIDMVAVTQKFKGQLHKLSKFKRIQTFQKKKLTNISRMYISSNCQYQSTKTAEKNGVGQTIWRTQFSKNRQILHQLQ